VLLSTAHCFHLPKLVYSAIVPAGILPTAEEENMVKAGDSVIFDTGGMNMVQSLKLVSEIGRQVYAVKAHALRDDYGPITEELLYEAGAQRVWIDYKIHEIESMAGYSARSLAKRGAAIISVHASGGIKMMRQVRFLFDKEIYAVTVPTSLSETVSLYCRPVLETVQMFASWAKKAGMNGIVCSAMEAGLLVDDPRFKGLDLIVAGVRSTGSDTDDQRRVDTPVTAIRRGARRIVVGRQIVQSRNPIAEFYRILEEIKPGLEELRERSEV
jgi:orotidine-5'-phosphate decarboxylase